MNDTLIFTVAINGYAARYRRNVIGQKAYAERLGAAYAVVAGPPVADLAIAAWLKVTLIEKALQAGYQSVAYIDTDCEVRETAPDFRDVLTPGDGIGVHMAEGRSGRISSGVIFVRNSERSRRFFCRFLESATEAVSAEDRAGLKYENGNAIFLDRTFDRVERMSIEWNNTYQRDLPDHIRHYTGDLRPDYTVGRLDEVLAKAQRAFARRPKTQPERRSERFVADLEKATQRVLRRYPAFAARA